MCKLTHAKYIYFKSYIMLLKTLIREGLYSRYKLKKIISSRDINSILKVRKHVKISQYFKFSFSLSYGPHFSQVKFPTMTMNTKALLNHVINYSLSRSKRTNQQPLRLRHPGHLARLRIGGNSWSFGYLFSRLQVSFTDYCSLKMWAVRVWKLYLQAVAMLPKPHWALPCV